MNDQAEATVLTFDSVRQAIPGVLADLQAHPPTTLTEAREKLGDLVALLRLDIDAKWASVNDVESPDHQAVMSEVSIRLEAIQALQPAIADLAKAEAAATTALERIFKKLYAPRTEARVWQKVRAPGTTTAAT